MQRYLCDLTSNGLNLNFEGQRQSFGLKFTQSNGAKPPMQRNIGDFTSEGVNDNFEVNSKSQ